MHFCFNEAFYSNNTKAIISFFLSLYFFQSSYALFLVKAMFLTLPKSTILNPFTELFLSRVN